MSSELLTKWTCQARKRLTGLESPEPEATDNYELPSIDAGYISFTPVENFFALVPLFGRPSPEIPGAPEIEVYVYRVQYGCSCKQQIKLSVKKT